MAAAAAPARKKMRTDTAAEGAAAVAVHNIDAWRKENAALFGPPICNKIMHKDELMIMFVGGIN